MSEHEHPPSGTVVRLKAGMPGTYEGLSAVVHHAHPISGHSNLPRLVWLECDVIWSHGTADGFWATRAEYDAPTAATKAAPRHDEEIAS